MTVEETTATCPRCGAPLELHTTDGGVRLYVLVCTTRGCLRSGPRLTFRAAAEDLWRGHLHGQRAVSFWPACAPCVASGLVGLTVGAAALCNGLLVVGVATVAAACALIASAAPRALRTLRGLLLDARGGQTLRELVYAQIDQPPVDDGPLTDLTDARVCAQFAQHVLRDDAPMARAAWELTTRVEGLLHRGIAEDDCPETLAAVRNLTRRCAAVDVDGGWRWASKRTQAAVVRGLRHAHAAVDRVQIAFDRGDVVGQFRPWTDADDEPPVF